MEKSISIIIPAFNAENTISHCIENIKKETKNLKNEIIVIDDCSTDNTAQILEKYNEVNCFKTKKNQGVGYARNFGAKLAKYEILFFIDSDVIVLKNSIENITNYLLENKDGSIGAVQKVENLNKKNWTSNFVCLKSCYGFDDQPNVSEASNIQSECCAIFKDTLKEAGGWKYYKDAGGEEYDLGYRINLIKKRNLLLKNSNYATYYQSLTKRFYKIIDRTKKYIDIFYKKKNFDTQGSFATIGQAFSSFLTGLIMSVTILASIFKFSYVFVFAIFAIQIIFELKFLLFAQKYYGANMVLFSLFGIHIINLGIILGVIYYIYDKIFKWKKS